jgi:hypothetical protein
MIPVFDATAGLVDVDRIGKPFLFLWKVRGPRDSKAHSPLDGFRVVVGSSYGEFA